MNNNERLTVYRIRRKRDGAFMRGGHSAAQGVFISLTGTEASLRQMIGGRDWGHPDNEGKAWNDHHRYTRDDFEFVEFALTEVAVHPVPKRDK